MEMITKKVTESRGSGSCQEAVAKRDLTPSNWYEAAAYTIMLRPLNLLLGHITLLLLPALLQRTARVMHLLLLPALLQRTARVMHLLLLPALLERTARVMHLGMSLCGVVELKNIHSD